MNDTRRAILDALDADAPVSGPDLADRLGVSRNAVWKHVEALREEGFGIESRDGGYALDSIPEFGGAAVESEQDAFDVEYHESIGSTNDRARELAAAGESDVVVLADEQTGGRGRLERIWTGPSGGVWMSLLLRPDLPTAAAPILTLAAAVAAAMAAREVGVEASIKWPNDILVSGANEGTPDSSDGIPVNEVNGTSKLAGILTEMEGEADRVSWTIVGIGINANVEPEKLPEGATSLQERVGPVDRRAFVGSFLRTFDDLVNDPGGVLDEWRDLSDTLGRRVRVETPTGEIVGEAVDVEFPGTLVVETDEGAVRVHSGDCEHLRPA